MKRRTPRRTRTDTQLPYTTLVRSGGVLATYAFDTVGHPSSVTFGNGSVQSFAYDAASRLSTLTNNLGGSATTHDLTQTFAYNPAGQIASVARSNDAYAWQAHYNVDRSRTEEHTSELQSLMRSTYAVFCLEIKNSHAIVRRLDRQTHGRSK